MRRSGPANSGTGPLKPHSGVTSSRTKILLAPVGPHEGVQVLTRIRRTADGFAGEGLLDVRFVPALKGIARRL